MKKTFEVIKTVLTWLIVLLAVCMMVFTIVSVTTFDRNDRALFGYKMYIVRSDSMSATDFKAGDLILVRSVDPTHPAARRHHCLYLAGQRQLR